MHHPIIVASCVAGYVAGAVAYGWLILGGITKPRYGLRVQTFADIVACCIWPVCLVIIGGILLEARYRRRHGARR